MRKLLVAAALAGCALSPLTAYADAPGQSPAEKADPAAREISADQIEATVQFLADDLLQGRDTGSEYYDIAAAYVASRYRAMGLTPGVDGKWMQDITFRKAAPAESTLAIVQDGKAKELELKTDFITGASFTDQLIDMSAPMVFVGQGIHSPENGIDDYAGLDVKGKVVVVVSGAPKGVPGDVAATLSRGKTKVASDMGAVGMISIRSKSAMESLPFEKLVGYIEGHAEKWVAPDGTVVVDAPNLKFSTYLSPEAAADLVDSSGHDLSTLLDAYESEEEDAVRPTGFVIPGEVKVKAVSEWEEVTSANVVAVLPGSDPKLADQYVVMSAHLDHVGNHLWEAGEDEDGEPKDTIYNGALDNAAGVATMLEVARVIAENPTAPRRPILFVALTGEEKGLLGSEYMAKYWVREDGEPVGVVNFDMPVLLYDMDDVVGFGAENSTMGETLAAAGAATGIGVTPDFLPDENLFVRSDHYSFVKEGVPALFLMSGVENGGKDAFTNFLKTDYHGPGDDLSQPLNWESARKFALLNYEIVKLTANADARPMWYEGNYFGDKFDPEGPRAPAPAPAEAAE